MIWIISIGIECSPNCKDSIFAILRQRDKDKKNEIQWIRVVDNFKAKFYGSIYNTIYIERDKRYGFLANLIYIFNKIKPEPDDIIVEVDLDDAIEPNVIDIIEKTYQDNPDLLLTHGSYRMLSGKPARFNGQYTTSNFRTAPWRASHLKTYKYKLFQRIKRCDLLGKDGKPFMICHDLAIMFPMMEMAGLDRIKYIPDVIYVYNDMNPNNDHKLYKNEQKETERFIRGKIPYQRIRKW